MILSVKVKTNSRINEITVDSKDDIIIKIAAPPHDGEANEALVVFLSKAFQVPKSMIKIISGLASHHKRVEFPEDYTAEIRVGLLKYRTN